MKESQAHYSALDLENPVNAPVIQGTYPVILYGTMALSMMGSLRDMCVASGPQRDLHSSSLCSALSKASRHSGGSRSLISSDTALSPLNCATKSAGSDLLLADSAPPAAGVSKYVSMTQKFLAILRGTGGNLGSPLVASSSCGATCSMRASVGCIAAGYCMMFV